jgi:hypothetical protein
MGCAPVRSLPLTAIVACVFCVVVAVSAFAVGGTAEIVITKFACAHWAVGVVVSQISYRTVSVP